MPALDRGRFDVLGIGNAIVDVVAFAQDSLIEELGLEKGAMTLVDEERSERLYDRMGPAQEVSGGSCANTMAALASMGGKGAYIGRVKDDALGKVFRHDVRASGVAFDTPASYEGPGTARCLIFVTPDAQRTMQTYLGACVELTPDDVAADLVAASGTVYFEGYLWDRPEAKAAVRKAIEVARTHGNRVSLTLSDSFCVERWRGEFLELIEAGVDVLFANEAEIKSLFETDSFDVAAAAIRPKVEIAALTRSAKGALILKGEESVEVAAEPAPRIVDTTGAGDLFAAGFLRGLAGNMTMAESGRLGAVAAAEIIQQYGARAERPLLPLVERVAKEAAG